MLQTVITNLRCAKNGIWGGDLTNYADCCVQIHDGNLTVVDESVLPCDCMQSNALYCCRKSVCSSVCPTVRCVYCDEIKWCTADILIPYETAITLVFWHQEWLVGDAPFPVKYSPKVTQPPAKLIVPCNQYISYAFGKWPFGRVILALCIATASRPAQNHWQCWQLHNRLFGRRQSHGLSAIAELLVKLVVTLLSKSNSSRNCGIMLVVVVVIVTELI